MERAYANVTLQIRDFIRTTLSTAGFSQVVVGTSGGVDSAASAALALEAVGPQNLFLAMMPYGESGTQGIRNAMLLTEALHLPKEQSFLLDIKRAVGVMVEQTVAPDRVRPGNIMARIRMIYLFDLAKRLGALVCGTENRTEQYLGYFAHILGAIEVEDPFEMLDLVLQYPGEEAFCTELHRLPMRALPYLWAGEEAPDQLRVEGHGASEMASES
jgi:NAD+ synthetase